MNNQMPPPVPPQNPYPPQNGYPQQMPPSQPGKKGNGLIIAIIVAALLLVGGGVAAFLLLRNKDAAPAGGEQPAALIEKTDTTDADIIETDKNSAENAGLDMDEPTGKGVDETDLDATEMSDGEDPEVEQVKQRLQRFQYSTYQNQRFGYQLNVPDFMAPGPESQNGDGRTFYFDGISLAVYASHNALEYDVAQQMDLVDETRQATRRTIGDNAFLLSGQEDDGTIYELKSVLKNDIWYTVRLDYPAKMMSVVAPLRQIVTGFEP